MKLSRGSTSLLVVVGIFGVYRAAGEIERDFSKLQHTIDARETQLRKFLHDRNCPVEESAGVFIAEADEHHLDWRLLPSLAFIESTGGKFAHYNNLFGWRNGATRFATRREAIHQVALAMANAPAYKGKDLRGKLWVFNHGDDYWRTVVQIMEQISPGIRELSLGD
jgi:hypothetical protein